MATTRSAVLVEFVTQNTQNGHLLLLSLQGVGERERERGGGGGWRGEGGGGSMEAALGDVGLTIVTVLFVCLFVA